MVIVIERILLGEHHRLRRQIFATMAERSPWNVSVWSNHVAQRVDDERDVSKTLVLKQPTFRGSVQISATCFYAISDA